MYLKQVELENFKSFGGKMTVPLMEGYMAVTGPNGSGKSNIADAIMFVLGPKSSKAVRAGRITDLLFDGGAAKNKAKSMTISLVFDNSDRLMPWDCDTVRLTRFVKLASNGTDYSSYFFINDQKSSLSEFDVLLTKARISADGYNLVQQGDVTHIVQMGNIERRRILDGISGIASFDADIQKAQGERAEANESLGRIGIIRNEKEKQLKALEKDKEQARIYLGAKAELDTANAQLAVRLRDNERARLDSIESTAAETAEKLDALRGAKAAAEAKRGENEKAIAAKEAEIEARAGPEYRKIKGEVEDAKIRVATENDRAETALRDRGEQLEFRKRFEESAEENRRQRTEASASLDELTMRFEAAERDRRAALEEEKRISEETAKHGGELTELQKKLEGLERGIDAAGAKDQGVRAEAAAKKAVLDGADRARAEAEEALESAKFEVKDAEWNLAEVKRAAGPQADVSDYSRRVLELKEKESGLERQEEELRKVAEARGEEFNRLSAEKRVSESYDSRNEAVSRILALKQSGEVPGIHGTIAQLAKVDSGWETALSVAAGGKMNAVIVDDDGTAAKCIDYLKGNRLGRVTFLPLTKMMPGKPRAKAIMTVKRTQGYATDLIDFDPRYTNAFWYVFQDTMVVNSMDQARELMGGIRLVTKQGELIEASGAMVGGTINPRAVPRFGASSQSALEKAGAALREVNDALEGVRADLRAVRNEIRAADDAMRDASASGVDVRGKIAEAQAAAGAAKKALEAAQKAAKDRADAYDAAKEESARADAAAAASAQDLGALRDERAAVRDRMGVIAPAGLQERIQRARDDVYRSTQAASALSAEMGTVRAEIAGLDSQRKALDEQIAEVDRRAAADEQEAKAHSAKAAELRKDLDALKKIEGEMEAGIEDLRAQKDALLERKYGLDADIDKKANEIEVKGSILKGYQAQILACREAISRYEEDVARVQVEIPQPVPSEEALRRTIKGCEARMASVGAVNLRALEDYDERRAELDSLLEQVARLEKQIKDLDALAGDLTSKKKGLFMEAYDAVDANFRQIYAQLSGGGEGFMALDDPDDPFSGGLQINAKPRNGKMLRLEALSGGEKSLTALSFIFAIQEYQPSPFYVLDEVDMFLDAVNAEMVAKRIKESSAKAQFIQVSLRKVTLTLADHLIGVTRPPSGISRVIMQPDLAEVSKYEEEALRLQKEGGSADV